jgi:hypothetical protein
MIMATEPLSPSEALSVSAMLNALEINGSADEETESYLVIPGSNGPRWLLPARSSVAAPVLRIWHPYNLSSRMKWLAVRMAARAGLLRFAHSVSSVETSRRSARLWFERCGIETLNAEIVVLIGTPSANRKLIAFLLDNKHRIAAVLKVGLTAGGGLRVLHEAEVLGKLECMAPCLIPGFGLHTWRCCVTCLETAVAEAWRLLPTSWQTASVHSGLNSIRWRPIF